MEKKKISPSVILLAVSVISAIAAVITRSVLTFKLLDAHGVYARGSVAPTVFHAVLAAVCIFAIIYGFATAPKTSSAYSYPRSNMNVFFSFALGFLFFMNAAVSMYNILKENVQPSTLDTLDILFSIPCAIFFFINALKPAKISAPIALTALFPTAWFAVYLIKIYFDSELLMTDPGRILQEVALLMAMVAFLTEARVQIGQFSHRFFLAAVPTAFVLLSASAIPNLLFSQMLMLGSSDSIVRCSVSFVSAIFLLTRLVTYSTHEAAPKDTAAEITPKQ